MRSDLRLPTNDFNDVQDVVFAGQTKLPKGVSLPAAQPVTVVATSPPAGRCNSPLAKVAIAALAITGGAALIGAALHRWGPRVFPRGRQSRPKNSTPFPPKEGGAVCPYPSVAGMFYEPSQFQFVELSHGRVRYILRKPASAAAAHDENPGAVGSRVVVLVHGYSIACDIWKQVSEMQEWSQVRHV
jgi:hypothetical protein